MRLGVVILPEQRWTYAQDVWRRAEDLGFDHAWTYDHLAWRSLRDSPWFGAVPTLTAAAAVTERIRLGTLVATPNFRHPVPFAKELVALDDVAGGRFIAGVGAGGDGWDSQMLGQAPWSPRERSARFGEFVEVLDRLLREPAASYDGEYYTADEARMHPGCVQQPRVPFAIAATGPRGMRLAARFGQAWVTTGSRESHEPLGVDEGVQVVAEQLTRLEQACADVGRDPATLDRVVVTGQRLRSDLTSVAAFEETLGRYAAIGITDMVVHWPRPTAPYAGDQATFERIVASDRVAAALGRR